jgi:hypothetical protein
LAKQQRAAMNRNKGKNASTAASILKPKNNKFVQKGISSQAALKANARRAELAARKAAKKSGGTQKKQQVKRK